MNSRGFLVSPSGIWSQGGAEEQRASGVRIRILVPLFLLFLGSYLLVSVLAVVLAVVLPVVLPVLVSWRSKMAFSVAS